MFKLIKNLNLLILLFVFLISIIQAHVIVFVTAFFLCLIIFQVKNPIQMWVYFIFNQYFSIRYIEIVGLGFSPIFGFLDYQIFQKYFLISAILLLLITFSVHIGNLAQRKYIDEQNSKYGFADKASILSIYLFALPILLGDYRIGRGINNIFSVLLVRAYELIGWTTPAIFRLNQKSTNKILLIILYILVSFLFGSKAFLINLINLFIAYKLLSNTDVSFKFFLVTFISIVFSILLFNSFQSYRLSGNLIDIFNLSYANFNFSFEWLKGVFDDIGSLW